VSNAAERALRSVVLHRKTGGQIKGGPARAGQAVVVHDVHPDVGDARQIRHGRGLKDGLGVVTSYRHTRLKFY